MGVGVWTVAEAKAKFSELVDKARLAGPQTVTKSGRTAVVVVSAEEWERKTPARETSPSSSRSRRCGVRA